jgi:Family of unknown function (DUF6314)
VAAFTTMGRSRPIRSTAARYRAGVSSDRPDRDQPADGWPTQAPVDSTVDFLSGDWNVERRICDRRGGRVGSFRGTASFRSCPEPGSGHTLAYVESGELSLGSHRGPAGRSLLVVDAGDGTADVRFADGRDFYRLDLRSVSCTAAHPCKADLYGVTVTRLSADSYAETWRVTGPEKDYELRTTYTRTACASPDSDAGIGGPR